MKRLKKPKNWASTPYPRQTNDKQENSHSDTHNERLTNTQTKVSGEDILRKYTSKEYLAVPYQFFIFGPAQAVWLSAMIRHYLFLKDTEKISDDWFFYTHEKQEELLQFNSRQINRLKKKFKELGIIETAWFKRNKKEWYRIDAQRLEEYINGETDTKEDGEGYKKCDPIEKEGDPMGRGTTSCHPNISYINMSIDNKKEKKYIKKTKKKSSENRNQKSEESGKTISHGADKAYTIENDRKLKKDEKIDFQSFIDYFNSLNGSKVRNSETKKRDIKKQLGVFTGAEIKKALKNRKKVLYDSPYLRSWESIFTRKIERMEKYLEMDPKNINTQNKPTTGYQNYEYEKPNETKKPHKVIT